MYAVFIPITVILAFYIYDSIVADYVEHCPMNLEEITWYKTALLDSTIPSINTN